MPEHMVDGTNGTHRRNLAMQARSMIASSMNIVEEDENALMTTYNDFFVLFSFSEVHPLIMISLVRKIDDMGKKAIEVCNRMNLYVFSIGCAPSVSADKNLAACAIRLYENIQCRLYTQAARSQLRIAEHQLVYQCNRCFFHDHSFALMVYSTKPFTCYFTFAALQSLPENDLMRLSQFVQEQAAVYRTVVERNSMLVFKIHDLRKIWVSGDETAGHSFAAVCKELPNPVVELLELIR